MFFMAAAIQTTGSHNNRAKVTAPSMRKTPILRTMRPDRRKKSAIPAAVPKSA